MKQESYAERLERECTEMTSADKRIKKIVDAVRKIDGMSNMEFDYEVERTHMIYKAVKELI